MRIAFITFENEICWGVRSIVQYLRTKGYSVHIYCLERYTNIAHGIPNQTMTSFINDFNPSKNDIVCMSIITSFLEDAKRLALLLRKTEATIVMGGIHPTISPKDCLPFTDYLIRGMGEEAMLKLIKQLEQGKKPKKGVFPEYNKYWFSNDVNKFPHPKYDEVPDNIINKGKLIRISQVPRNMGIVTRYQTFTSFGCPHACSYCVNSILQKLSGKFGRTFIRRRSISNVISELVQVRNKIDSVAFEDEDFLTDSERIVPFLKEYKKKINLPFSCLVSPATLKTKNIRSLVEKLKEAGCSLVLIGIQTASPKTSKLYNRPFNKKLTLKIAKIFSEKGIYVTWDIIAENPMETEEDFEKTVNLVLSLPPPFAINMFYLTLYPNYPLTLEAMKRGIKPCVTGYTKINQNSITSQYWVVQLAQFSILPRGFLKFLYRKRQHTWAKLVLASLGHSLTATSPTKWILMLRILLSNPQIALHSFKRRFISMKKSK